MLIAKERVDSWIEGHILAIICKLDIEKAYMIMLIEFLVYLLERMRFGKQLKRLCLSKGVR